MGEAATRDSPAPGTSLTEIQDEPTKQVQEVMCNILLAVEYWIIPELRVRHISITTTYHAFLLVTLIRLVPHAFLLSKVLFYLGTNQRPSSTSLPFPHVGHVPKLSKLLLLGLEKGDRLDRSE